jgi:hypothetical protein
VSRIDEQGHIYLQDGRTLPENYKQFTHGYAVTAHRSQGKSVDAVVISADGMRRELFYVAASRGREGITVVTGDKELLREMMAQSVARQSASELSHKAQEPSLARQQPSLREIQGRETPVGHEQTHRTMQENVQLSASRTGETINHDQSTREQKHEQQIAEPSQYFGISR